MSSSTEIGLRRSRSYQNIIYLDADSLSGEDRRSEIRTSTEVEERRKRYSTLTLPLLYKHKKRCSGIRRIRNVKPQNRASRYSLPPLGRLHRAPSQVTMHYTTVPQSLVTRPLGSRHHPTRSSLRRSRLLVMVQNGPATRKQLPGVVEQQRNGVLLSACQLTLGAVATALAVWRLSNSSQSSWGTDWPYFSGILILASGFYNLVLLVSCRYLYPGIPRNPYTLPIRAIYIVVSVILSSLSMMSSFVSSVCYGLHILTYSSSNCQDAVKTKDWPEETCVCISSNLFWRNGELVYPSTSCTQVDSVIPPILWTLLSTNFISFVLVIGFLLLLTSSQHVSTFKSWRKYNRNNNNTSKQSNMEDSARSHTSTIP